MQVVYDCRIREVMGYPERNYRILCGESAFFVWNGYLDELMRAMWSLYGYEPDPHSPSVMNINQMPFLRQWNEGHLGSTAPFVVTDSATAAIAFRTAVASLRQSGSNLAEVTQHGEALATFIAKAAGHPIEIEEVWG